MDFSEATGRKRQRALHEDEISEFTPLSKRINNLHINNSLLPFAKPLELSDVQLKPELHRSLISENLCREGGGGSRSMDACPPCDGLMGGGQPQRGGPSSAVAGAGLEWLAYSPDLSPTENPFYYDSNRLLFELYLQRSRRNSHF